MIQQKGKPRRFTQQLQPKKRQSPRYTLMQQFESLKQDGYNTDLKNMSDSKRDRNRYTRPQSGKLRRSPNHASKLQNQDQYHSDDNYQEEADFELLSKEIDEDVPIIHSLKTKLQSLQMPVKSLYQHQSSQAPGANSTLLDPFLSPKSASQNIDLQNQQIIMQQYIRNVNQNTLKMNAPLSQKINQKIKRSLTPQRSANNSQINNKIQKNSNQNTHQRSRSTQRVVNSERNQSPRINRGSAKLNYVTNHHSKNIIDNAQQRLKIKAKNQIQKYRSFDQFFKDQQKHEEVKKQKIDILQQQKSKVEVEEVRSTPTIHKKRTEKSQNKTFTNEQQQQHNQPNVEQAEVKETTRERRSMSQERTSKVHDRLYQIKPYRAQNQEIELESANNITNQQSQGGSKSTKSMTPLKEFVMHNQSKNSKENTSQTISTNRLSQINGTSSRKGAHINNLFKEDKSQRKFVSGNSKKFLVQKFKKMFRNSLCKILKDNKLSSDQIIYEEESIEEISANSDSDQEDIQQADQGGKSPKSSSTITVSKVHIPTVEDINLSQDQYYIILKDMNLKGYNEHLADKMYQILTCNQQKLLRSSNQFTFLLACQGLFTFEEIKKPDLNIDEECDYGAFNLQGRFIFINEGQYKLVRKEFKGFQSNLNNYETLRRQSMDESKYPQILTSIYSSKSKNSDLIARGKPGEKLNKDISDALRIRNNSPSPRSQTLRTGNLLVNEKKSVLASDDGEPQWVSIDIDLGKTKGMKKILMKHDENVSEVVNKFALENNLDENKKEKLEKIINLKLQKVFEDK
ncbi:UNKNOWN [Stylonychia lemnae]|uniref:Uncharacterized protein n=1 Tax=Stylonychia lemnae TaxID=5949 RepID=A0A078AHL8_STYLE|nr:UNKNOWN [Stylonychia lemnae]|eukprot:CDW80323.1 UNKNOWN [Stylonychia lemnae]